jgi:hypothetical protein
MEPWEVSAAITARIEALVPDASYRQDADDAWRQCEQPLIPELAPEHLAHLSFWVDDRDGSTIPSRQNADEMIEMRPRVVVRFLARLRPNSRNDDWTRGQRALVYLLRHLNTAAWQTGDLTILLDEPIYSMRVVGNDYIACELRLRACYQTPAV